MLLGPRRAQGQRTEDSPYLTIRKDPEDLTPATAECPGHFKASVKR